jgi:hypothetical protein
MYTNPSNVAYNLYCRSYSFLPDGSSRKLYIGERFRELFLARMFLQGLAQL